MQIYHNKKRRENGNKSAKIYHHSFFFGFFGFLDRDFALQSGQMGALRCICWWQLRQLFMGGGCCWYLKGGGVACMLGGGPNPALERPREPNSGDGWPAMEKKGLWWGGGRDNELEMISSGSRCGFGQGSVRDLSFSRTPAARSRSRSSSPISGSLSRSSRSVRILLTSWISGTYSDNSLRALS